MINSQKKLVWKDEYSVNVVEIDNQHKNLFEIINNLIEILNSTPKKEEVADIINKIVEYKIAHFGTEEKYFNLFNYEGSAKHIDSHKKFNEKLQEVQASYKEDTIGFAFALVNFLEDWLINHLMYMDQEYKKCFNEHGLK